MIRGLGFGSVTQHGVGAAKLQIRERPMSSFAHNSAMVKDFLEPAGGFATMMRGLISFSSHTKFR